MKKLAFIIECYNDSRHEIPVVVQVEEENKPDAPTTLEVQCPICQAWNKVDIGQPLAPNTTTLKGRNAHP